MTNGNERIERIERILEQVTANLQQVTQQVTKPATGDEELRRGGRTSAIPPRQQYRNEAFERHDAEMKSIREALSSIQGAISLNGENIRTLARIAEPHNRRLEDLEGGTT